MRQIEPEASIPTNDSLLEIDRAVVDHVVATLADSRRSCGNCQFWHFPVRLFHLSLAFLFILFFSPVRLFLLLGPQHSALAFKWKTQK